jgi:hypothetical protein
MADLEINRYPHVKRFVHEAIQSDRKRRRSRQCKRAMRANILSPALRPSAGGKGAESMADPEIDAIRALLVTRPRRCANVRGRLTARAGVPVPRGARRRVRECGGGLVIAMLMKLRDARAELPPRRGETASSCTYVSSAYSALVMYDTYPTLAQAQTAIDKLNARTRVQLQHRGRVAARANRADARLGASGRCAE